MWLVWGDERMLLKDIMIQTLKERGEQVPRALFRPVEYLPGCSLPGTDRNRELRKKREAKKWETDNCHYSGEWKKP